MKTTDEILLELLRRLQADNGVNVDLRDLIDELGSRVDSAETFKKLENCDDGSTAP